MKVEVAVMGSLSPISLMVSADVKKIETNLNLVLKGLQSCLIPSELRRCVEVEVVVPSSPSLILLMVSVDVKKH